MRWLCWHDWSKWKTYRWEGSITPWENNVTHRTSRTQQARVCAKCGMEMHRVVDNASGSEYDKLDPSGAGSSKQAEPPAGEMRVQSPSGPPPCVRND